MSKIYKPGQNPPKSGEYTERGPQGGNIKNPRQATIETGDKPLPPTSKSGNRWERTGPPKP